MNKSLQGEFESRYSKKLQRGKESSNQGPLRGGGGGKDQRTRTYKGTEKEEGEAKGAEGFVGHAQ